ncbi:MAG: hypothetical protein KAT27_01580 [Desulfobacterales bacterium]|nr:hypothetical protein [Desulfobacterales bacterium]
MAATTTAEPDSFSVIPSMRMAIPPKGLNQSRKGPMWTALLTNPAPKVLNRQRSPANYHRGAAILIRDLKARGSAISLCPRSGKLPVPDFDIRIGFGVCGSTPEEHPFPLLAPNIKRK